MSGLTTHVLDTAQGRPAAGIDVRLYKVSHERELLQSTRTNDDGRTDAPLLNADEFQFGTFEIEFAVADYFRGAGLTGAEQPFLDEVTIRFTISQAQHYHIPLLVSPWSYSTYRGS